MRDQPPSRPPWRAPLAATRGPRAAPEPPPQLKACPPAKRPEIRGLLAEAQARGDADLFYAAATLALRHEPHPQRGRALAEAALREALRCQPDHPLAEATLIALLEAYAPQRAARWLMARGDDEALLRAGALAARAHQHAEALARWDRAQATPPTLARALLRLRLLDLEGASRDINALLRRISGDGLWEALLLERVWLAIELDEPPARIDALLERGLERLGPTPALIARLETYALSQGRHALLLRGLEARLEAAAPEDRHGARVKRAWALERLGRWEEALVAWREAHAQRPEDHEPLDRALALCRRLGRVELEWSLLQRRATRPGLDAAAIYYQAGLLAREILDEPARAAEDFERAVAARPDFGPALAALGRADLRQGRHEDLDARFQAEIEALSEDEEAHRPRLIDRLSRLAELRAARGDQITAARLLWRAHALDPRAPTAPLALRLAEARRWRDLARLYLDPPPLDDPDEATRQRLAAALLRLCAHEDEAAARIYERRLQRDPQDDEAAEGYLAARPGDLALRVAREEGGALRAAQRAEWLADGGHQATERYLALSRQAPDDPLILEGRLRLFARAPRLALLEGLDPSADPRIAEAYLRLDQHTALLGEGIAAWIARAAATRLGGRAADVALMTHARALEAAGDVGGAIEAWATAAISQAWRAPHRAVEAAEAITRLDPEHAWAGRLAPLIEASARPRRAAPAHEGGEAASRRAALLEMACRATGDEAEALRALAEPSADDARRRFEAAPRRRDLFLRALAGATPSQARALRLRRLNFAPPDERRALLRGLITDGLARGDEEATTQAMEALARLDPADLTLALARDHLDGGLTPPAALLQATAAPRNQLALHRRGARDPDLTIRRRHLEAAVALAPEDRGLLDALAETLTALGDAHAVAALDAHDEGHPRRLLAQAALMSEPRAALRLKLSALRLSRDPRLALEVLADAGALGHAEAAIEAFQLSDQGDEARARLARAHAADPEAAAAILEPALGPDAPPSRWALSAEIEGQRGAWRGVARALTMQIKGAATGAEAAGHAEALGEVFSRALQDHRRAAGWFKRAVELDPLRASSIWRMIAAARAAPAGEIPQAHIDDALDRAIAAMRGALSDDPLDVTRLQQLARLLHQRGAIPAAAEICAALVYLGAADQGAAALHARHPLRGPLWPQAGATLERDKLISPQERGPTAQAWALCAPVFELPLSAPPTLAPPGPWRALVEGVALALGIGHVQVGLGPIAPHPPRRVDLDEALLDEPLTPPLVFEVIRAVEALSGQRALLILNPLDALARLHDVFFEGGDALFSPPGRARLAALSEEVTEGSVRALAEAVELSADRAALLWAGDPAPILDQILFEGPKEAAEAHRRGTTLARLRRHDRGRALFGFWISARLLELRGQLRMAARL